LPIVAIERLLEPLTPKQKEVAGSFLMEVIGLPLKRPGPGQPVESTNNDIADIFSEVGLRTFYTNADKLRIGVAIPKIPDNVNIENHATPTVPGFTFKSSHIVDFPKRASLPQKSKNETYEERYDFGCRQIADSLEKRIATIVALSLLLPLEKRGRACEKTLSLAIDFKNYVSGDNAVSDLPIQAFSSYVNCIPILLH
jgi:hypothetical protein